MFGETYDMKNVSPIQSFKDVIFKGWLVTESKD